MRILHTSDWHLGSTLRHVSRGDEHDAFLRWLLEELAREHYDALVVAGDVFDRSEPAAADLRRYYEFLGRLAASGVVDSVVVVGGNHDAAARLDAPADILASVSGARFCVVGGWSDERIGQAVHVVNGADGAAIGVICAMPFAHEYRLGVRVAGEDPQAFRAALRDAFAARYTALADEAEKQAPGVPIVATGHLTCAGASPDDFDTPLHRVGQIDGVDAAIFDARFDYVALGHIHAAYPVEAGRVWYSGTPVALGWREARTPRAVLRVTVAKGGANVVEKVPVPQARRLHTLTGDWPEIEAAIASIVPEEGLAAFVLVRAVTDALVNSPASHVQTMVERHHAAGRLLVMEVQQERRTSTAAANEDAWDALPPLSEIDPAKVFELLVDANDKDHSDAALTAAFAELLAEESR